MFAHMKIVETSFAYRWHLGTFLILIYLISCYHGYRRLSAFRGPWLAQFTDLWLVGVVCRRRSHSDFYQAIKEHGPITRIGPNTLITTELELISRMNSPKSLYRKSDWYLPFQILPGIDSVFTMRNNSQHEHRRAQVARAYLGKDIKLEATIDTHVTNLISLLRTRHLSTSASTKVIDLSEKVNLFTIDVVTELATGTAFGDIQSDSDKHGLIKASQDTMPIMISLCSMKWVIRFLHASGLGKIFLPKAGDGWGFGKLIEFSEIEVAERFATTGVKNSKPDMLTSFMAHDLTLSETVAEALIVFFAGSDSTASAMSALMLYVISCPHVYATLRAAISSANIGSSVITDAEARGIPYLQAVILEGLRICPPTGSLLPKLAPPGGVTYKGLFIPGGVEIGINQWGISRNTSTFGDDIEVFRPERWLGIEEEKYKSMERAVDQGFGNGKNTCLGKRIALMEVNKLLVELMRNFDWAIVDPKMPMKSSAVGFLMHSDLFVTVRERSEL